MNSLWRADLWPVDLWWAAAVAPIFAIAAGARQQENRRFADFRGGRTGLPAFARNNG